MVNIGITRMSSKGQIVIPQDMRNKIKEGEKLLIIESNEGNFILKKASKADEVFQEDLEFARRTEEAWQEYDKGNFKSYPTDEFLKRLKKW